MATHILLRTGAKMPIVGLGTWQSTPEVAKTSVEYAIDCGYRHIDTAFVYQNEKPIGEAINGKIKEGKVKREDLFIVTKLHGQHMRREDVKVGLQKSLAALGLSYIDLYLVHGPVAMKNVDGTLFPIENGKLSTEIVDHLETWKGMEDVQKAGLTKAIGLSNFNKRQIQRIYDAAEIKPANLQVECHAYFPQKELYSFCKSLGITFTAYAPIGSPGRKAAGSMFSKADFPILLDDAKVKAIAEKYKKTPAQIALRWLIQREIIAIPKSVTPERIKQNFQIFDFALTPDEFNTVSNLGVNQRTFPADNFGVDHPEFPFTDPY